ncbi:hypothetical protein Desti_2599 [Desulfomonile tiedjei DSM 6799]|uniref:Uncharacterized protein n=1 Tax=Desulfomonile tiedjei (strain ATCC 49306 / DSM 6799 / DCB-1) TaxID=706587 RepID=I4C6T8_DESTA|nr:hypothetical protein Desti_2599 [Desulfomonile tiedjei DSM 6799]
MIAVGVRKRLKTCALRRITQAGREDLLLGKKQSRQVKIRRGSIRVYCPL